MSKRRYDSENKENEPESGAITTHELVPAKRVKTVDQPLNDHEEEKEESQSDDDEDSDDDDDDDDDDEDEDEEQGPIPIAAVLVLNEGTAHPTNKQYIVYEDTDLGMVSKTARFWSRKYLKIFPHVDPDRYDMYVHNDFVCYGELEIIENCLLDLAKGTFLKHKGQLNSTHQITAFRRLEALTIVLEHSDNFPGIDDGERFCALMRVIGACYVSILASSLPKSLFHGTAMDEEERRKLHKIAQQLPNFKEVIQCAIIRGYNYLQIGDVPTAYTNYLYTIYCNWSSMVEQVRIDLSATPEKKDEQLWQALKHAAKIKRKAFKESFNFLLELDEYSKMNPDLGGNAHDLRKWSKARRQMYSFDNDEAEPAANFWFRL